MRSLIPADARPIEAYRLNDGRIIVMQYSEELPDDHNCDEMGCGSFSHVERIIEPREQVEDE